MVKDAFRSFPELVACFVRPKSKSRLQRPTLVSRSCECFAFFLGKSDIYIFTLLWYGKLAGENTSRRPTSQRKFTLLIVCGIPPRLCCNVQLEGRLNAGSEFSPLDNRGCDEPNHTKIVKLSPENISYQKKSHQQQCRFATVCFRV